jgi:hypothetical protein
MAGFLLPFLAVLFIAVSANPITYEQEGRLHIINAGNNILEAIFFTEEMGIGIYGDNSNITIISMSDHEVLLSGSAPSDSSRLYRVLGTNFLQQTTTGENGEPIKHQFIVPESLIDRVKEDIKTRKEQRITSQLTGQSETEAKTAQALALMRLFTQREISLIEPAAKALGRAGVMGYENQGALHFYAVAMALIRAQDPQNTEGSGGEYIDGHELHNRRTKRGWWWSPPTVPPSKVRCTRSNSNCNPGRCISGTSCNGKCADEPNCVGRCGPGCWWCWSWFCGDCCYNHGCYEHDICCTTYLSFGCAIPIGFSCTAGYTCY